MARSKKKKEKLSERIRNNEIERGLNAFWIRLLAIAAMVVSFINSSGKLSFNNTAVADCMFWFSYTLFAFLLTEGVNNTSNRLLYIRRFAVFTVISEVAYDFYTTGNFYDMQQQSVMVTLFICLLIMMLCDYLKRRFRNIVLDVIAIVLLSIGAISITGLIHSEFGKYGVLIAMFFYTCHDLTYRRIFELAVMVIYSFNVKIETIITVTVNDLQYTVPITVFAILALIVTFFYNENRGPNKLWLKILFYLIYPLLLAGFALINILL